MSEEFTIPTLTLTPDVETTEEVQAVAVHTPAQLEETQFSPEELQMIEAFSDQIDVTNSKAILMYGAAAQKHVAEFADSALQGVRAKDLGEVGKLLGDLMVDLKGFDNQTDGKGLFGIFKNAGKQMEQLKARYGKLEGNVGSIARTLEDHQVRLLKDVSMLDKMYDMNKKHFKETSMYIVAGEKKLAQVMEAELPKLRAKAEGEHHLVFPQGDGVGDRGLDFFYHHAVVGLDKAYLRAHLYADVPGELQVVELLVEAVAAFGQVIGGLGVFRLTG